MSPPTLTVKITRLPQGGYVFQREDGTPIAAVTTLREAKDHVHAAMQATLGSEDVSAPEMAERFAPSNNVVPANPKFWQRGRVT